MSSAADLRLEKLLEKEVLANAAAPVAEGRSAAHETASSLNSELRVAKTLFARLLLIVQPYHNPNPEPLLV